MLPERRIFYSKNIMDKKQKKKREKVKRLLEYEQ